MVARESRPFDSDGVRGELSRKGSTANEIRQEMPHPSPLFPLPFEGRGKPLHSTLLLSVMKRFAKVDPAKLEEIQASKT